MFDIERLAEAQRAQEIFASIADFWTGPNAGHFSTFNCAFLDVKIRKVILFRRLYYHGTYI